MKKKLRAEKPVILGHTKWVSHPMHTPITATEKRYKRKQDMINNMIRGELFTDENKLASVAQYCTHCDCTQRNFTTNIIPSS